MTEAPPQPPAGAGGQDPWPPRRDPPAPPPVRPPAAPRGGLLASPRHLAALAALAAAGLATAGALVVLVFATSPFGLTLAERLREATGPVLLAVPLLLAAALVLVGHGEAGGARTPGPAGEVVPVGVAVVACTFGVLAAGRFVADLLGGAPATGWPVGGAAGRLRDVLVDLAALVLTVALVGWASRRDAA